MVDMDQGVLVHLLREVAQICLDIEAFQGGMDLPGHPPELLFFFHQMDNVSLVCYGQGAVHACNAPADDEGGLVHIQVEFLQRLKPGSPGN